MRGFIVRWLISATALGVASWLVKGIQVHSLQPLLVAALALGFLNAFLRPILIFFTLPLNLLTLGLFTFVINAFLLLFVSQVVGGFDISGFLAALVGTILLSFISFLINLFVGESGKIRYINYDR